MPILTAIRKLGYFFYNLLIPRFMVAGWMSPLAPTAMGQGNSIGRSAPIAEQPAGRSLASSEVGILRYHSHLKLVDRMGLTTRSLGQGRILSQKDILLLHRPDYFMFYETLPHVVVTPDLQYRMVKQFPRGKYKPITILEKCDDCPPDLDVPGAHHVN